MALYDHAQGNGDEPAEVRDAGSRSGMLLWPESFPAPALTRLSVPRSDRPHPPQKPIPSASESHSAFEPKPSQQSKKRHAPVGHALKHTTHRRYRQKPSPFLSKQTPHSVLTSSHNIRSPGWWPAS